MTIQNSSARQGVCRRSAGLAPLGRRFRGSVSIIGGGLIVAATLSMGVQPAGAQSLDDAISSVLDNGCAGLGGSGVLGGALSTFCAGGGVTGGSAGGGTTASQSGVGAGDQQGKIKKRLSDLRNEKDEKHSSLGMRGSNAGSSDTTFSLGALSGYVSMDYVNVDKDTTSFTSGFQSDKFGGTVGLDSSFGKWVVGAALNFAHEKGSFDSAGGNFNTDSYGGLVYASVAPIDNLFFDAFAGYAYKDTSLQRNAAANIDANTTSGTESSKPDTNEYSAGISGGYDFNYKSVTFGPRFGVNYTRTEIRPFSESGTSGLELAFDRQTVDSLTFSFGGQVSTAISTKFGVLVPQASADYIHEFANGQQTLTAHFVLDQKATPTTLSFQNDSPDRNYFGVGAGLVMVLPHGLSPYANYRALVGDSIKSTQTVTAGLRFEF